MKHMSYYNRAYHIIKLCTWVAEQLAWNIRYDKVPKCRAFVFFFFYFVFSFKIDLSGTVLPLITQLLKPLPSRLHWNHRNTGIERISWSYLAQKLRFPTRFLLPKQFTRLSAHHLFSFSCRLRGSSGCCGPWWCSTDCLLFISFCAFPLCAPTYSRYREQGQGIPFHKGRQPFLAKNLSAFSYSHLVLFSQTIMSNR